MADEPESTSSKRAMQAEDELPDTAQAAAKRTKLCGDEDSKAELEGAAGPGAAPSRPVKSSEAAQGAEKATHGTVAEPAPAPPAATATEEAASTATSEAAQVTKQAGPPTEEQVGITQYVNNDDSLVPFSGILKHRFTDFLVFEVALDGQVARLTDLKQPAEPAPAATDTSAQGSEQAAEPKEEKAAPAKPKDPTEMWTAETEEAFKGLGLDEEKLVALKQLVQAGPPARNALVEDGDAPKVVSTHAMTSKDERTNVHKAVREQFGGRLATDSRQLASEGGDAANSHVIDMRWASKAEQARNAQRSASGAAKERGTAAPYVHFTLQKQNMEMHDALARVATALRVHERAVGTAGTKDKRAVTCQRVSVRLSTGRGGRGGGGGVDSLAGVWKALQRDTHAASSRGGRGRGRGGRGGFQGGARNPMDFMRVGNLTYAEGPLELGQLKGNKFVITLRDIDGSKAERIASGVESVRKGGFINYFGLQRFGTSAVGTHEIGRALLQSDWTLATELILSPRPGEAPDVAAARAAWADGQNAKEALTRMPRRAVAERALLEAFAKEGGMTDKLGAIARIPKNLRLMYVHAYQSALWNKSVSERVRLYGAGKPVVGDLVLLEGSGDEEVDMDVDNDDADKRRGNGPMTVSDAVRLSKVAKVKALDEQDLASGAYSIEDVVMPLPGFAVEYPAGPVGQLYRSLMRDDGLDPDDMFRKQKDFSMGGTYRKVVHIPQDVSHRFLLYQSPDEDLAQTDEDAAMGRNKLQAQIWDPSSGAPQDGQHVALQIELTLGSSTYATMALRELTRGDTSKSHHSGLTRGMEARAAVP